MNAARFPWKRYSRRFPFGSLRRLSRACFGTGFAAASTKQTASGRRAGRSERGFVMLLLCPVLTLALLFFAGSVATVRSAQRRVALQSRLDICAVRAAAERKQVLARITETNQQIRWTVTAISMARGASLVTGPIGAVALRVGQAALVRANGALALWQEKQLALAAAGEWRRSLCTPTPYSDTSAYCLSRPPIRAALRREKTIFIDVRGPLVHAGQSTHRCFADGLVSTVELTGDPALREKRFRDQYRQ